MNAQTEDNSPYLVANAAAYEGQYVTTEDFCSNKVVTHSASPSEAYNQAIELGYESPVIIYVPSKNEIHFAY
ncbi:hypothetical protein JYT23_01915 [Mariprofundus ferrooxydans]|nr:hypothetical protein [Mariprofundus ferrooxydans]